MAFMALYFMPVRFCFAVFINLAFLLPETLSAQHVYRLAYKTDVPLAVAGLGTLTTSYFLGKKREAPTAAEISALDRSDIWRLDRFATRQWSPPTATASDVLMYSSIALPGLLFINKNVRKEHYVSLMYAETMLLTAGVTNLVKELTKRYRPFTYNENANESLKYKKDARLSFFSGHTSLAATSSFFMAKVFSDLNPESKLKPFVWTSAAVLPAVMGLLRVFAGKHYPTDVIVGYVTGAAIGFLVPYLHKKPELRP